MNFICKLGSCPPNIYMNMPKWKKCKIFQSQAFQRGDTQSVLKLLLFFFLKKDLVAEDNFPFIMFHLPY